MKKKLKKTTSKALTLRQKTALRRHQVHHTKKHMAMMRKLMKHGKTFQHAHRAAMKKVGK